MAGDYAINIVCNIQCDAAIRGLTKQRRAIRGVTTEFEILGLRSKWIADISTRLMRIQMRQSYAWFWTGLSIMFTAMAVRRYLTRLDALTRRYITLERLSLDVIRLQAEYRRVVEESGRYSEEAIIIHERLTDAQMRLKTAQALVNRTWIDAIVSSTEFAFGLVSLIVRLSSHVILSRMARLEMVNLIRTQIIAAYTTGLLNTEQAKLALTALTNIVTGKLLTREEKARAIAHLEAAGATVVAKSALEALARTSIFAGISLRFLSAAIPIFTLLTFASTLLFTFYQLGQFQREVKETYSTLREEYEKTFKASPIKIKAGIEWIALEDIGKAWRGIFAPVELPTLRFPSLVSRTYAPITINIQADIRREEDLRRLAKLVEDATLRVLYYRGKRL